MREHYKLLTEDEWEKTREKRIKKMEGFLKKR